MAETLLPLEDVPDLVQPTDEKNDDEELILEILAKLYRFDKEKVEWKERGTGPVRIIRDKKTGKVRFLMRRGETMRICGNHYIIETMKLRKNKTNDKSWIWYSPKDYFDGKYTEEIFAIRFETVELCDKFKTHWDKVIVKSTL